MSFELSVIIKTSVLLACAWLTVLLMWRSSSSTRHALWVIALFSALLLPIGSASLPTLTLPVLRGRTTAIEAPIEPITVAAVTTPHSAVIPRLHLLTPKTQAENSIAPSRFTIQQALTSIWALGFLIVFIRLAMATRVVRRLAGNAKVLGDDDWNGLRRELQYELRISSPVQLRMGSSMPPMTWGVFHHVILLPESAAEWTSERRRVVLAHELAHVKRHDGILQIFVQIVCSVYWFSPMVWYAAHRLRIERERACDDQVLNLGAPADDYADHLLQIARGIRRGPSFAAVSMAEPSQLEIRLMSILDSRTKRRKLSRLAVMGILIIIGVLTASIAAIQVTALAAMALPSFETPLTAPSWLAHAATPEQQEQASGTAALEGMVVRSGTTEPVPHAHLVLNAPGSGNPLTVTTDDSGRFAFQNLTPGRYQLLATRNGYVHTAYGQRGPTDAGSLIALASKQVLKDIVLSMTPTGAISGKIRNQLGEPVANVAVQALKYGYDAGRQELILIQTARTNDLGEYRLYYLDPGQYVVCAIPPTGPKTVPSGSGQFSAIAQPLPGDLLTGSGGLSTFGQMITVSNPTYLAGRGYVSSADTGQTYVPVFFPGVTDPASAAAIKLEPGTTLGSTNFTVTLVRAARVRGKVTDPSGTTLRNIGLLLSSQGIAIPGIPKETYAPVSDDGVFEFRGIAPGSYDLVASAGMLPFHTPSINAEAAGVVINREPLQLAASNIAARRMAGHISINVGNGDLENVTLPIRSGYTINGKIIMEGLSSAESASITNGLIIQFQPELRDIEREPGSAPFVQTASSPVAVKPDGTFTITDAFAGVYQIGVFNAVKLPIGTYVKSAQLDEKDVLAPRLIVEGIPYSSLDIVIATNPGALDVRVTVSVNEKQSSTSNLGVVLLPDASRRQHYELYRAAVTDDSGLAHMDNVTPGDYKAYVSDDLQNGVWWDPEFMKKYEERGKAVHISEGGKQSLDLKWTPYD